MKETVKRSILKTFTWRIIATSSTILLVYIITGSWSAALSIGIINFFLKAILYFLHERAWNHSIWGKKTYKKKK